MSRRQTMWMLILLILPLAALAYVSWHVWVLLPFQAAWKAVAVGLGICCFLSLFLDFTGSLDRLPLHLARILYEVGTSSLIVLLYLAMLFLLLDVGRLLHLVPRAWLAGNGLTSISVFCGIFGLFFLANVHYHNKVRVQINIASEKPLSRDYTILCMSDLHLGYHNTRSDLARWIDMIKAERPDFVLIAGDIIDVSTRPLMEENMAEEFQRLGCPVYACLGNHEYYAGSPQAQRFYADAGIQLLRDSVASVDGQLAVIGRDDRTNFRRKNLPMLMEQADNSLFTILLDHQPYALEESEQAGVDFQLSGHTHRGQVWPVSWITDFLYECSWGSHRRGQTNYYVSSGLGIWGGKFRIGTQSEYLVLHLAAKP